MAAAAPHEEYVPSSARSTRTARLPQRFSARMVKVVSKFKFADQQLDQGSNRSMIGHSATPVRCNFGDIHRPGTMA